MRKRDDIINKFGSWLFGDLLPKEYYPDAHEDEMQIQQVKRIAEFCMCLLIILTTLYFGLGSYLAGTPEPEWWVNAVEPWLLNLF